jgi:hypothetical protein
MTRSERPRRVIVAVLTALAVLTLLIGVFTVWINRQVLNTDNWTKTSGDVLENKNVQRVLSAYLVDQIFTNVDVSGALQNVLPPQAAALAGPAAAGLQELAGRAAPKLLANPTVQDAWRVANRAAHKQLLAILNDDHTAVSTANGVVTLNLHPIVDRLAARLGISEEQLAAARAKLNGPAARGIAQQKLGVTLPPSSGEIEILRSDELATAQDAAQAVRHLAVLFTALPLLLFALAIGLASGWRRIALRTTGWCFIGVGLLVLLARRVGSGELVDALVQSSSVRPAVASVWTIGTTLLYDIAVALVFYGLVMLLAAWLAGATRPAYAVREAAAPAFRHHLASVYGVVAILFLLLLAWGPTPAMRKPLGILLFAALIVLGIEILRRQIAREFPDAEPGHAGERMKEWFSGARGRASAARSHASARRASGSTDRYGELEQLASLRDRGVLTDEEFASQKTLILEGTRT